MNSELENLIDTATSSLGSELKLECKHDMFFYAIPSMMKSLTNYLAPIISKNLFKEALKKATSVKNLFTNES